MKSSLKMEAQLASAPFSMYIGYTREGIPPTLSLCASYRDPSVSLKQAKETLKSPYSRYIGYTRGGYPLLSPLSIP